LFETNLLLFATLTISDGSKVMDLMGAHDSYLRFVEAATRLPTPLTTPSQIAKFLSLNGVSISSQMMANWKKRGLSKNCAFDVAAILNTTPHFLLHGEV
jgi:hypothetical protein